MESHPEEFDLTFRATQLNPEKRWEFIVRPLMERAEAIIRKEPCFLLGFLSDEEVGEVFKKLMYVQGDLTTQRIMNELLRDQDRPTPRGGVKFGGNSQRTIPFTTTEVARSLSKCASDFIQSKVDDSSDPNT
jgi:hypothetical protein